MCPSKHTSTGQSALHCSEVTTTSEYRTISETWTRQRDYRRRAPTQFFRHQKQSRTAASSPLSRQSVSSDLFFTVTGALLAKKQSPPYRDRSRHGTRGLEQNLTICGSDGVGKQEEGRRSADGLHHPHQRRDVVLVVGKVRRKHHVDVSAARPPSTRRQHRQCYNAAMSSSLGVFWFAMTDANTCSERQELRREKQCI